MKRILLTIIITAAAVSAAAQPRSIGLRSGVSGFEADYHHAMAKNQFLEANLGIDFGYNANGNPGIKATAIYNFVWAHPAWTEKGTWALYAGPGVCIGHGSMESIKRSGHTPFCGEKRLYVGHLRPGGTGILILVSAPARS